MSDDVIKVHDLSGIEQYSESISQFSKALDTATNDTARAFNNKIEGSEGIAISSFLQSLNDLQTQIFDQIPEVLGNYAKIVEGFSSSVSGIGFGKEAWTSESGNSDVRTKLTGEQKDSVLTVDKNLQTVLDTAATALGEGSIDISNITNNAINGLEDAATARLNTHTPFQAAHDTFNTNLQQVIGTISALKGTVGQAQITLNFSPKAVFNMISQGLHMNPLDTVKNIDEARALDSVYGDNQTIISQVNRENVRDEVVFLMVDGIVTWVYNKDTEKLDAFYNEFGKMKQSDSQPWLDKFTTFGQVLAVEHQGRMAIKYEQVGHDYSLMESEFKRENAINEVIGINRGLYAINYGKGTFYPKGSPISVEDIKQIKFRFDKDGRTKFSIMGQASGYKMEGFDVVVPEYSSDFKVNSSALNKEEIINNLNDIDQKRQEVVFRTIKDIAAGVGTFAFPKYKLGFELLKLWGSDASDVVDDQLNSEAATIFKGITDSAQLKEEELTQIAKLKREMVGKGGWIFEGGLVSDGSTQRIVSDESYYRFEVSQRIAEMNKYGMKLFFEKRGDNIAEFEMMLRDPQKGYDNDVINYVVGKDSNLNLESMNRDKLTQVYNAISELDNQQSDSDADDGEKYFEYLKTKYNRNINMNH